MEYPDIGTLLKRIAPWQGYCDSTAPWVGQEGVEQLHPLAPAHNILYIVNVCLTFNRQATYTVQGST
jgi:hypothetical protein